MTRSWSKPLDVKKPAAVPSRGLLLYWRLARHEMALLAPVPKGKAQLQFLRLARAGHPKA